MLRKMVVAMAFCAGLMGLAGGPSPALANTEGPQEPPAAVEMVERADRKMTPEMREFLQNFRKELNEEREKTKAIVEELRQDRAKLHELVKEARQNGEKEKLELLEPLKVEAKAIVEATRELREQKRQAWEDLRDSIRDRDVERAKLQCAKILELKKLINYNLNQLDAVLDRSIAILD